jgi:hypothetical protein
MEAVQAQLQRQLEERASLDMDGGGRLLREEDEKVNEKVGEKMDVWIKTYDERCGQLQLIQQTLEHRLEEEQRQRQQQQQTHAKQMEHLTEQLQQQQQTLEHRLQEEERQRQLQQQTHAKQMEHLTEQLQQQQQTLEHRFKEEQRQRRLQQQQLTLEYKQSEGRLQQAQQECQQRLQNQLQVLERRLEQQQELHGQFQQNSRADADRRCRALEASWAQRLADALTAQKAVHVSLQAQITAPNGPFYKVWLGCEEHALRTLTSSLCHVIFLL